ncbi:hypothetical protein BGX27_004071 [Mortierella sp. AM989]|nr:hypothetical protein BGX27_004071 [Mortierella sp. AM989]
MKGASERQHRRVKYQKAGNRGTKGVRLRHLPLIVSESKECSHGSNAARHTGNIASRAVEEPKHKRVNETSGREVHTEAGGEQAHGTDGKEFPKVDSKIRGEQEHEARGKEGSEGFRGLFRG